MSLLHDVHGVIAADVIAAPVSWYFPSCPFLSVTSNFGALCDTTPILIFVLFASHFCLTLLYCTVPVTIFVRRNTGPCPFPQFLRPLHMLPPVDGIVFSFSSHENYTL